MCFRVADFVSASAASDYDELVALGHVSDTDSPHILAYVDPIESAAERPEGEDPRGVELKRHPSAMLRDDPDLWDIVDRFRCGTHKELTHSEFESLSNFQLEAWIVMRAAHQREEIREIKTSRGGRDG